MVDMKLSRARYSVGWRAPLPSALNYNWVCPLPREYVATHYALDILETRFQSSIIALGVRKDFNDVQISAHLEGSLPGWLYAASEVAVIVKLFDDFSFESEKRM